MKVLIELFARHLRLQVQIQVQQFCIHFQLRDWYIRACIMIVQFHYPELAHVYTYRNIDNDYFSIGLLAFEGGANVLHLPG